MPAQSRSSAAPWVLALVLLLGLPEARAARTPQVVFDSEYGGYVAIVDGVVRPDLTLRPGDERAPFSRRRARRRARRTLRRQDGNPAAIHRAYEARLSGEARRVRSRWLRKSAIVSQLLVLDPDEKPVEGARIYRFHDPSFYPVNESVSGRRLFGTYRYLPYPFPAEHARKLVTLHDELARLEPGVIRSGTAADIDRWHNPWLNEDAGAPSPALELVGTTNASGMLRVVSGVMNLFDEKRFPGSIVPRRLNLGFIVVHEGFTAEISERAYEAGGIEEERTVHMLAAPGRALLQSHSYRVALRLTDALDVQGLGEETLFAELTRIVDTTSAALARVVPAERAGVRAELEAALALRLLARAPEQRAIALARFAAERSPNDAGRSYLLARELAKSGRRNEAESLLVELVPREPGFVPAYALLDRLLREREASDADRRATLEILLRNHPFDRWGRARLAAIELEAGNVLRAFDHLRYTWMNAPGLGHDEELARRLSRHFWSLGAAEKAATFVWLLTGAPPEDPFRRVEETAP